jgi:hypothetical protein
MCERLLPAYRRFRHRPLERSLTMKNPFVITASVAAIIVVAALATLGLLAAFKGQNSGLEKSGRQHCPKLSAKAARDVTNPAYGERLAKLAHCTH